MSVRPFLNPMHGARTRTGRHLTAAFAVCALPARGGIAVLDPNGPVATSQARLMAEALALMAIVVLPVFALCAVICLRYAKGRRAAYRPEEDFSLGLDIAIWTVPALIVAALAGLVWTRTLELDPYAQVGTDPPVQVQAIALDWKWIFIYPDEGVASVNRLTAPAGRLVEVAITSDTVMNAFFIPGLAGQIFAMAGMRTELNFLADTQETLWGRNTQYSGSGFADQEFTVEITDSAGYDAFISRARQAPQTLDRDHYDRLAAETSTMAPRLFADVSAGLFADVIARYGHAGPAGGE